MIVICSFMMFICLLLVAINIKEVKSAFIDYRKALEDYRASLGQHSVIKRNERTYYNYLTITLFFFLLAIFFGYLIYLQYTLNLIKL